MVKIPLGLQVRLGHVGLWAITDGGLMEVQHWPRMSDALVWLMKEGYADSSRLMSYERLCAVYEGMQLRAQVADYNALYEAAGVIGNEG